MEYIEISILNALHSVFLRLNNKVKTGPYRNLYENLRDIKTSFYLEKIYSSRRTDKYNRF